MKKLIVEVWKGTGLKQLESNATPEGMMLVEGVVGRVDSMNRNKRFYPKGEYSKHVEDMSRRIQESNGILGEMEHPKSMNINLHNVSHKVMELRIDEDGYVRGKILLLDTPKGKIAQSIVRSGSPLPISSRGIGMTAEDGAVTLEYMATYDLVGTAGFAETGLKAVSESLDGDQKVISEFYEYAVDNNGDIITEGAFDAISESIEAKLVAKYDKLLSENVNTMSSVKQLVAEEFAKNVEQVQSFIGENAGDVVSGNAVSEARVLEMITTQFLESHTGIIENWATNHMLPKAAQVQEEWMKETFTKSLCEGLETWVFETVLPKNAVTTEKWLKESFANDLSEGIQNWVQGSFTDNLSEGIQNWMQGSFTDNLSEGIENWIGVDKHKQVESNKSITENVFENLDARIAEAKAKRKLKEDEDTDEVELHGQVDEAQFRTGPAFITKMPARYKHIYQCLNEDQKASIHRRASVRMLNTVEDVETFWNGLKITNETLNLKPGVKAYNRTITEAKGDIGTDVRANFARMAASMK